jgi:hypothetical protein
LIDAEDARQSPTSSSREQRDVDTEMATAGAAVVWSSGNRTSRQNMPKETEAETDGVLEQSQPHVNDEEGPDNAHRAMFDKEMRNIEHVIVARVGAGRDHGGSNGQRRTEEEPGKHD